MKYLRRILLASLAVVALGSCKTEYDALLEGNDADAKYKAAFELFNSGKFTKAAQMFESLSVLSSGTERDDTVQYYWGLSNYKGKDYELAETNLRNFIEHFPRSPFVEMAKFLRVDCVFRETYRYELDQTPTYRAMTEISQFLTEYPGTEKREICNQMMRDLDERLDRKAFENARLYYKMEDYKAARVAFKNILKDDSDNIFREEILYYTAMSSYKYANMSVEKKQKERFLVFEDDYLNFIGEYPESKHRHELENLHKRLKK